MTPKEKAEELVDKMKLNLFSDGNYDASRCAMVCVAETINELNSISKFATDEHFEKKKLFWQEVKQELIKMK